MHPAPPPILPAGKAGWDQRAGALSGIASALLPAAAFRYAHHWGGTADAIVAGWAISTLAGISLSLRALDRPAGGGRLAVLGLASSGVSVTALVVVGAAYLVGADPTGPCGGG
jgi:hypothetical protein